MFRSVLTVCVGNICRSPMAEGLLRADIAAKGLDVRVASAGIAALVDHPADQTAIELMSERGIDISGHRARQLTYELLKDFDLVLVMETGHQQNIEKLVPAAKGRVFTLGHWENFEIDDPYRQPREAFEQALELIERGITTWMRYLK